MDFGGRNRRRRREEVDGDATAVAVAVAIGEVGAGRAGGELRRAGGMHVRIIGAEWKGKAMAIGQRSGNSSEVCLAGIPRSSDHPR